MRRTRKEAARALRELQRQPEDGVDLATGKVPLGDYLNQWIENSVKSSVRPKTYTGYRSVCESRIIPNLGKIKLANLTPAHIQSLYADLAKQGLSPRSIVNTHQVLRCTSWR